MLFICSVGPIDIRVPGKRVASRATKLVEVVFGALHFQLPAMIAKQTASSTYASKHCRNWPSCRTNSGRVPLFFEILCPMFQLAIIHSPRDAFRDLHYRNNQCIYRISDSSMSAQAGHFFVLIQTQGARDGNLREYTPWVRCTPTIRSCHLRSIRTPSRRLVTALYDGSFNRHLSVARLAASRWRSRHVQLCGQHASLLEPSCNITRFTRDNSRLTT